VVSPAGEPGRADQPGLVGHHHQLGAVAGAELDLARLTWVRAVALLITTSEP
jgi:hypothetical protein